MVLKGVSEEAPGIYADHALYAKFVLISAFVMFASALGIQFGGKFPVLVKSLRVLAAVATLVALVTVVMTGHEGARLLRCAVGTRKTRNVEPDIGSGEPANSLI